MFRRLLPVAVLVAAGCGKAPPPDDTRDRVPTGELAKVEKAEVNAEGATFVEPIMKVWTNEFQSLTGDKVIFIDKGSTSTVPPDGGKTESLAVEDKVRLDLKVPPVLKAPSARKDQRARTARPSPISAATRSASRRAPRATR